MKNTSIILKYIMDNFAFLQTIQKMQLGVVLDTIIPVDGALLAYSAEDKTEFWNNALTRDILDTKQLARIEQEFQELDRKPAIYFVHEPGLKSLVKLLVAAGYTKSFEDTWQFWDKHTDSISSYENVKIVASESDLEVFMQTFNDCYVNGDPMNPYGELGDYLKTARKAWHTYRDSNQLEYYVVYKQQIPVAVSALRSLGGIGYISNVGSLPHVRGEGFGKIATLHCVKRSVEKENTLHCLATEEGAYPYDFYRRIGFEVKFSAVGFIKNFVST